MKKMIESLKRKIAAVLVVVMALQTVLISVPPGLATVHAGVKNRVDLMTGEPDQEAFEELYVETGTAVGKDGDRLSMRFGFRLSDEWLEEKLYEAIDNGMLADPGDYDSPQEYDNYLEGVGELAPLAFTCTVNDGVLDVPAIQAYIEENRDIYTSRNEKIGTWNVEHSANGPMFTITLDKKVYSRSNVTGNRGLEAQLLEKFQPGDTVDSGKGTGGVDLNIRINGTGEPVATNSDYIMEKTAESGDEAVNADGETDPSAINFTISVRASASNAEKGRMATASGWAALASPAVATASFATASDPEDEIPYDERDGELVLDWWNFSAPMKSSYIRQAVEEDAGLDLTGKYVVDSIPDGLNLDAVEVSYNGAGWERLDVREMTGEVSWENHLADRDRLFSYQILPDEEGVVTEFEIRFYTRISDALWEEYGRYGVLDREFPNKAVLKDEDETTTLTVSNLVNPSVHWESLIAKDGVPLDVNGDVFRWKIHVDAHFSSGVNLYLIDHIVDTENTHHYILDDPANHPVRIEAAGKPEKTFDIVKLDETELGDIGGKEFQELSIDDIEGLLGKEDRFNDGVIYVYEQTDAVSQRTDAYMLIPMTGYTNGESTITYDTDIRAAKDQESLEYEAKLANEVKPVWKWYGGLGPGEAPFGEITVKKEYPIRVNVVNKKAAGYHPESNTISWEFDVNQRGVNLDRVLVMDDLQNGTGGKTLAWTGLGEGTDITLVYTSRRPEAQRGLAADRTAEYVSPDEWDARVNVDDAAQDHPGDYYTIDGSVLKIRLDGMGAEDYYKYTVDTLILDGNYAQDGTWTVENTASVIATANGKNTDPFEIGASIDIEHSLISKYVEPFFGGEGDTCLYNYEENTVQWRVKVNADGRRITDAVMTDTLPLGTTFDRITAARQNGVDGTVSGDGRTVTFGDGISVVLEQEEGEGSYPGTTSGSYSADKMTFRFSGEINEPYEFVFTTVVDENFRREILKSGTDEGEPLTNRADLTGKIDGTDITGAHAEAVNRIMPRSLLKEGTYHGLSDYTFYDDDDDDDETAGRTVQAVWLSWEAYVNRTNVHMAGAEIWDTLEDCFELIPSSLQIDTVTLDARGKIADESQAVGIVKKGKPVAGATPLTGWEADDGGFRFVIPEAYDTDTLRITFDTVLADDAAASQMVNTIHAKGNGWEDSSAEASDDKAMDFMLEDYATAEGMIFLRVLKSSENHNAGTLYLEGAEFSLQKLKLKRDGDKKKLADWEATGSPKKRTTRANGSLSYLFLQPDVMYRLKETKAPNGYKLEDKTWNVVARLENSTRDDYPDDVMAENIELLINQDIEKNSLTCEIDNGPDMSGGGTNELRFVKTGQNGQILPGTVFTLKSSHQSWTAAADENGVVSFPSLDPLGSNQYYTLRETKPDGYERLPAYYVSVVVSESGVYEVKLLNEKKEEVSDKTADQIYVVKNRAIKKDGSFVKTDQNGEVLQSEEVTFELYRKGDGGTKEAGDDGHTIIMKPSGQEYYPYLADDSGNPLTVESKDGVVKLDGLYFGYYKLIEKDPAGGSQILKTDTPATIYIKVDGNGIKALPVDTADPENASDSKYTERLDGRLAQGSLTVSNTLKWGFVQVNKVLGTYNGTSWEPEEKEGVNLPLEDVVFGVYRKNPDGSVGDLYMRLKTGADGSFLMDTDDSSRYQVFDQDGRQTGTKALLCGDYYLTELSAPEKYVANSTYYPFTIGQGTGDSLDGYQAKAAVYIDSEAAVLEAAASEDTNTCFLNKPVRQPVRLVKEDADYGAVKLDHALFHVYVNVEDKEFVVAELKSTGSEGRYELAPADSEGCETCGQGVRLQNDRGERYLEKDAAPEQGGGHPAQYLLLPGDYVIRETTAPDIASDMVPEGKLYPLNSEKMYADLAVTTKAVSITAGQGTLAPVRNETGFTVKNRVKYGSVKLSKYIMTLKQTDRTEGEYVYGAAPGFTFTLSGTPANYLLQSPAQVSEKEGVRTWSAGTNENGVVAFDEIPVGIYKLEETDVPAAYKDGEGNWLVDKAPDIWVKIVPAAGDAATDLVTVGYCSADGDGKPGEALNLLPEGAIPQHASGAYRNPEEGAAVYNALKLADVEGTKLAVAKGDGRQAPLGGAEFTLTHSTLTKEGKPYTFVATTDDDGRLIFTDVPYGAYILSETNVPEGFQAMADLTVTITDDSLETGASGGKGTYWLKDQEGSSLLQNQIITADALFCKLDQNGTAIANSRLDAQFAVEKTSSAVEGNDFWGTGEPLVSTDEMGYLTLKNLSYGVYNIKETLTKEEQDKLDSAAELVEFWLEVKAAPEAGKTEISVYGEEPSDNGVGGFVKSLLRINAPLGVITVSADETADFTDVNRFDKVARQMTNVLKHGSIQIHKVGGDAAGDSGHDTTVDLEGVTFEICKEGESAPYLTLKTDARGRFPQMGPNGIYKDAITGEERVLYRGNYTLKEVSAKEGYAIYADPVEFTITDRSETIFFGYDGTNVSVEALSGNSGSDVKFYNIPERGKLEFVKKDSETGKILDGAVFLAYTDEARTRPAAFIAQPEAGQRYEIIGEQEQVEALKDRYAGKVGNWQDKIDGVSAVSGNDRDGYSLKTGTYYLKEIEAPKNYVLPSEESNRIEVTIEPGKTTQVRFGEVAGLPADGVVANQVVSTDLSFSKKIETSGYRPHDVAEGMRFVLKGTSSNAVTEDAWSAAAVSRADGTFSFEHVPAGSYTLYECDRESDTNTDPYLGFVPGTADEVEVLTVLVEAEDGLAKVTCTKVEGSPVDVDGTGTEITNRLKYGSIAGKKVSAENTAVGLKDAYFGIFCTREDAVSGSNQVAVVRSSDDGEFVFENVPYGIYYIRELKAPYGYVPATTIFKAEVREAGQAAVRRGINVETDEASTEMTDIVFANGNKRGAVRLEKKASPSNLALDGAVFTVYAKYSDGILDHPVAYLTDQDGDGVYTLADGEGLTGQATSLIPYLQKEERGVYYLIQGHYWVVETTVPDGYQKEMDGAGPKAYPVTISGSGPEQQIPVVTITNDEAETAYYNELMTGGFTVQKTVESAKAGDNGTGAVLAGEGFRFRIEGTTKEAAGPGTPVSRIRTLRIDGAEAADSSGTEIDGDGIIVTTGAEGIVCISGLPIGTYTVTETDGPDMELYTGTEPKHVSISQNDSQTELEVTIDGKKEDGAEAILAFHNELKRYRMEGKKTDEKGMPLAGAVFGLYSEEGQSLYHTSVTDEAGIFAFEKLPTGRYMVKEIAPCDKAYLTDDTEHLVEITGMMNPEDTIPVADSPIVNVLKRGFVRIEKEDPEDRNHIFSGVRFTLYAKDGVRITELKQEDNRFVLASPSDASYVKDEKGDAYLVWDGRAQKTALIYGDYYIEETAAEPGYLADIDVGGNPVKHAFSIAGDGETVLISNNGSGTFENYRAKGSFEIRKEKEIIGEHILDEMMDTAPGEGFTFRISYSDTTQAQAFADADIREFAVVSGAALVVRGSGSDRWIEVTTGADGRVVLSELLSGQYTVSEVRRGNAADAYLMPSYQVVRVEEDQTDNTVSAGDLVFRNILVRGSIEGLKVAAGDRPLAGAVIGLFPVETTRFTEDNLFYGMRAVSGEDGKFLFENVPYGSYRIAELQAPSGYYLNEKTSYLVKVEKQGMVVTTGIPEENGTAAGTDMAAIRIENRRRSGGGGGGSDRPRPGDPTAPTNPGPGVPTEPAGTTAPDETTAPVEPGLPTDPVAGERPTIPFDPDNPVINIPGDPPRVEIADEDDTVVYEGPGRDINIEGWEPGDYTVYTFDDQDVPLGTLVFTIDEEGVPLAFMLPKTGDTALPYALLAAIMLGALGGMGALVYRRRKERLK